MARMKMKDLERITGVSRETIRYYIRERLLPEPEKPSRNAAWYDESFVERIALIKELQRKRYLPLQVIKAILDADAAPSGVYADALGELDGKLFREAGGCSSTPQRMSRVAARHGLPASEVLALAELGVIGIDMRGGDRWLDDTAMRIVEHWAELRRAGFTDDLGFEPRNLRLYVDFVALLSREELRLFADGIGGRVDAERAARMAESGVEHVNAIIGLMRKAAILQAVREYGIPATTRRADSA